LIDNKNNKGWYNHVSIAKLLLESNANVNIYDHRKWTPLMVAVYHGYYELIELLLKYDSDLSIRDIVF